MRTCVLTAEKEIRQEQLPSRYKGIWDGILLRGLDLIRVDRRKCTALFLREMTTFVKRPPSSFLDVQVTSRDLRLVQVKKPCDRSNRILNALINMNFQATSNYRWLGILFFRWLGYHVADNSPESGSIRSGDIAIHIPTINPKESVLQQQNLLRILWFGRAVDYLWPIGFEGKRGSSLVSLKSCSYSILSLCVITSTKDIRVPLFSS